MTRVFFTSDLHFNHKRVIEFCNRPYGDVAAMNAGLIAAWNQTVNDDDEIYVLGDFCFSGSTLIREILAQLKGRKHLIIGNHDKKYAPHRWVEFGFLTAEVSGDYNGEFLLSHYPFKGHQHDDRVFPDQLDYVGYKPLLHGHVHCEWKRSYNMINVGCDVWNYRPVEVSKLRLLSREPIY